MFLNKRVLLKLIIGNTILALLFLFISLALMSIVMEPFESGEIMSGFESWLVDFGSLLSRYFMVLVFLFPESIRQSFWGGVISYISSFIMTIPITFGFYSAFKYYRKRSGI